MGEGEKGLLTLGLRVRAAGIIGGSGGMMRPRDDVVAMVWEKRSKVEWSGSLGHRYCELIAVW